MIRASAPILLLGGALAAGCSREDAGGGARALHELERLAFVPAGACAIEGYVGRWADCSVARPFLVDRYEVTRRDWLHYFPEPEDGPYGPQWTQDVAGLSEEQLDWPAFLSREQAVRLAQERGMRLLTAREWIYVATGRRSYPYPWGTERRTSVANTAELGLGTPSAVGVFEGGRSQPYGCYDLLGNVWEWVSDRVPGYQDDLAFDSSLESRLVDMGDGLASVLGGSFHSRERPTFGGSLGLRFHARLLDQATISPEIGVRLGADAEVYLWEKASHWAEAPEARARLEATGRRWASASGRELVLPLLEELAARPGAPSTLAWLLAGARARP